MDTVYIVTAGWDHEGENNLAVTATPAVAKRFVAERTNVPVRRATWSQTTQGCWVWRPTREERVLSDQYLSDFYSIERHKVTS